MSAGQLVVALLESGFRVRSATPERIVANHAERKVILVGNYKGGSWQVRTSTRAALPRIDMEFRRPDSLIFVLTRAYGEQPSGSPPA